MKKNGLFWRMFGAFFIIMLTTALLLSLMMVVMVRNERTAALENEVHMQTRDVARLLQQYGQTSFWSRDSSVSDILNWKFGEIEAVYDADIWLVTPSRRVYFLMGNEYESDQINDEEVIRQIGQVLLGKEIRVQGLISELGPRMVTIGVPWLDAYGRVNGAVLLHISTESLSVDYSDLIRNAIIAASASLAVGAVLAFFIARRQAEPIRQIRMAVLDFSKGKLDRRVVVNADDEMAELASAFNSMAEDLSRLEMSRRSFVANVSHELRSPLTCIRGYIEGMLDGTIEGDEREKYMSVVLSETNRLSKMVGELLDLTRIESGNMALSYTNFDLCELARLELIKFEGRIEDKGLEVEVELPDAPIMAHADADCVRQVVTNLLDNAVKFACDRISLSVQLRDRAIRVTIANDGEPISDEDLPHIFDRFYKADKAHTAGQGTGLGLSIVKRILEQMNEQIHVDSGNQGTSFTFTLSPAEPNTK